MIIKGSTYKNNKTDATYMVTSFAINTTNVQDGQIMVMYKSLGSAINNQLFVRHLDEFENKFTLLED